MGKTYYRIDLLFLAILIFFVSFKTQSDSKTFIQLDQENTIVWLPQQTISGKIENGTIKSVKLYHNGQAKKIDHKGVNFSSQIHLKEGDNKVWIVANSPTGEITSDTISLTLGYRSLLLAEPFASVLNKDEVKLHAGIGNRISEDDLTVYWEADSGNPAPAYLSLKNDTLAKAIIPKTPGVYYFNFYAIHQNDTARYQTYVTRTTNAVKPFEINSDENLWMRDAVIYQITPFNMVENGQFKDITKKLPELKELGINTIWLQPIFSSHTKDQGYDVTDYLKLNPEFGNEKDLKELIKKAKELDLRVIFDVVLNHTSIHHPYAQDRIKKGEQSHYFDYYQHQKDHKPYSSFYKDVENNFIVYFWDELVNLNYDNKEVQQWMIEVLKHWVKEYDIDGYRFDAIWGVNSRNPAFAKRMSRELKYIKPDLFLLAEAKGSDPEIYKSGFDAAYDWSADTSWISQWAWEYELANEKSFTVFNHPNPDKRGSMLKEALFVDLQHAHKKLRFIENNDQARFIEHHGLKRTKMAAALTFALPGIPMLYNGQEIGNEVHPYDGSAIFLKDKKIKDQGNAELYHYYQELIALRKKYSALRSKTIEEVTISDKEQIVAFKRKSGDEEMLVILNLDENPVNVKINSNNKEQTKLEDVLNKKTFANNRNSFSFVMEGYSIRILQEK